MKRIFPILTLSVCLGVGSLSALPSAVFAQANTITIIHEDGSQDVISLDGKTVKDGGDATKRSSVLVEPEERRAPRVEVNTSPAEEEAEAEAQTEEEAKAEEAPVAPKVERIAPPVSEPVEAVEEEKPAPKAKPKAKAKPKPKPAPKAKKAALSALDELAIIPPRKPVRRTIQAGEPITKDKAVYIALSEALPSRDVQVYPRETDHGLQYSVIFKTEDGAYEVVVDAISGVIVDSGALEVENSIVKPGHLPAR